MDTATNEDIEMNQYLLLPSQNTDTRAKNTKSTVKSKKKVKKWKKPAGKPNRPLSAYNLFFAKTRKDIIDQPRESSYGFASLARIVAGLWKDLSEEEKEPYKIEAAKEQVRYKFELDAWKQQQEKDKNFGKTEISVEHVGTTPCLLACDYDTSALELEAEPKSYQQDIELPRMVSYSNDSEPFWSQPVSRGNIAWENSITQHDNAHLYIQPKSMFQSGQFRCDHSMDPFEPTPIRESSPRVSFVTNLINSMNDSEIQQVISHLSQVWNCNNEKYGRQSSAMRHTN